MTCLALRRASFDAVAAFDALMHGPRREYAALLHAIASWVRLGEVVLATLGVGDLGAGCAVGNDVDSVRVYNRFFADR
jgi:hypothetical protein